MGEDSPLERFIADVWMPRAFMAFDERRLGSLAVRVSAETLARWESAWQAWYQAQDEMRAALASPVQEGAEDEPEADYAPFDLVPLDENEVEAW